MSFLTDKYGLPDDVPPRTATPNAQDNLSKKRGILKAITLSQKPHRVKETLLTTKDAALDDVDTYLAEILAETFDRSAGSADWDDDGTVELINGARFNELSVKQQQDAIVKLHAYIKREQHQCLLAAQEKQLFFQEAELLKNRVKHQHQQLLTSDHEVMMSKDEFRNRITVYKQKLKNLLSDQYGQMFHVKTEELNTYTDKFRESWKQEQTGYRNLMTIMQNEAIHKITLEKLMGSAKMNQVLRKQSDKDNFLALQESMVESYENHVEQTRKHVEDHLKDYIKKVDQDKNFHINYMLDVQARSLNNLKNYFQDIVSSNADMINDLKTQLEARRIKLDQVERAICRALEELQQYQGPMQKVDGEISDCQSTLAASKAVKERLTKKHLHRKLLADDVKRYRWMREIEETRIQKCKDDLADLDNISFSTKFAIMQKSALSNVIHSRALNDMSDELNMYNMSLLVLQNMSGKHEEVDVRKTAQDILKEDRCQIGQLMAQAQSIQEKHEQLWQVVGKIFKEKTGTTIESIGFRPPNFKELFPQNLKQFRWLRMRNMGGDNAWRNDNSERDVWDFCSK